MVKRRFNWVLLVVMSLFLFSCTTTNVVKCCGGPETFEEGQSWPLESFVKVWVLLDDKPISTGSGTVIEKDEKGSYILTAAHVCQNMELVFAAMLMRLPMKVNVMDIDGEHFETEIIAANQETDVCVLYAEGLDRPVTPLAEEGPIIGQKYFNMAAPLGWSNAHVIPLFEGYYSGILPLGGKVYELFTIPVQGGSSGSPVINQRGEVVGMIIAKAIRMDNLALGPIFEDMKNYIIQAIEENRLSDL